MRNMKRTLQIQRISVRKFTVVFFTLLFVICTFSGCGTEYWSDKFRLPLENDKVYWGMQASEFQTVMEKFDYEIAAAPQADTETLQTYAITASLKTKFGQTSHSQFLFNNAGELVMIRFFYADLPLADLNAKLTQQYGLLEHASPPASDNISYPGEYYVPDGATAEDLTDKDYQKLKAYLVTHSNILSSETTVSETDLETAVETFLQSASVFLLKTGTDQDDSTGSTSTFVEVNGEYLALLYALS